MFTGKMQNIIYGPTFHNGSLSSEVSAATRLRAGQSKNRFWIPGGVKKFVSSPNCLDWLWGPNNLIFSGHRKLFLIGALSLGRRFMQCRSREQVELYFHSPHAFMACRETFFSIYIFPGYKKLTFANQNRTLSLQQLTEQVSFLGNFRNNFE